MKYDCGFTKENKKAELAIIIGMLIAGITEPYLFNLSFKNLILVFAGNLLYKKLSPNHNLSTYGKNSAYCIAGPREKPVLE